MPSSPEDRLAKAIWGKPELMYDRRQVVNRRSSWRGGRRASDWPDAFSAHQKRLDRLAKVKNVIM
jgi:hypothetical protein